jgi:hypothetical protein
MHELLSIISLSETTKQISQTPFNKKIRALLRLFAVARNVAKKQQPH